MTLRALLICCALPLLHACALGQIGAVVHPTISGAFLVRGVDGTQTQWVPDRCSSGDLSYFLGLDFGSAQDGHRLRAVREPTGETLVLWTTPTGTTTLRAPDCAELQLDIQPTGWRVNEVREFAGSVKLRCTLPDGGALQGRIGVDHCH